MSQLVSGSEAVRARVARGRATRAAVVAFALASLPQAVAAATLRALGDAAASAHTDIGNEQKTLTPGPDFLQITIGATASYGETNPSPPPAGWAVEAIVDAIGVAEYGSLAGHAHAESSSLPSNTFFLAGGEVTANPGYTDAAEVVSDSLAPGTPVTLRFRMTLDAAAVHVTDVPGLNPPGTGAAARHEISLRDLDVPLPSQVPAEGALVINSRGLAETSRVVELQTAVGHRVELAADLFVSAGVQIDYTLLGFSDGLADVAAENTAELFFEPTGDLRLVTDSGHDYTAPEPGRATLLGLSAGFLLLRRRRD